MESVPLLEWSRGRRHPPAGAEPRHPRPPRASASPSPPLLPTDPWLRARARQLAEMVNSGIQPFQTPLVLGQVKAFGGDDRAWVQLFLERGLAALEEEASRTAGRFCVGRRALVRRLLPRATALRGATVQDRPHPLSHPHPRRGGMRGPARLPGRASRPAAGRRAPLRARRSQQGHPSWPRTNPSDSSASNRPTGTCATWSGAAASTPQGMDFKEIGGSDPELTAKRQAAEPGLPGRGHRAHRQPATWRGWTCRAVADQAPRRRRAP